MDAIEIYAGGGQLLVQPCVIERAVRALGEHKRVEALALIRGAYINDEGAAASLDEAREIFASIMNRFFSLEVRNDATDSKREVFWAGIL